MRKLALILLVGIIVVAYANIADNLGENKLRTKSQMTSSGGMWLEHPKMKETLIRPTPNTNSTVITEAGTALNMAKFDGDPNLALRNEKVANWYTYGNWGSPYYLTWASPERATMFVPAEFGIAYPCTISKVKTQFYQHPSYPWPGSNYTFKIYADDGSTLLWQSENLIAQQYPNVCSTDVTPNVVITSGNFYVAVCPAEGQNGFPSTLADNVTEGRSFYGQPGNWTAWTSGEFFISAYVSFRQINWDMRTVSINAPAWTTPYQKFSISALFKNLGVNTVSPNVPVKMRITGPEGYLYQDLNERTRNTLAQNDTERVYFSPQWQAPNVLGTYTVKVWCELAGDENPINDTAITTIEVTNWLTYAEWDDLTWATWAGPERMVWIVPSEFGVLHPITIDTLKAAFMWITRPWKDSTFKFKIYAGDGMTLLYESDTIRVTPPVGVWEYTIVKHAVNPPVTINSGTFCVAIAPRVDSMPFSAGSETLPGRPKRSFYGSPGSEAWTLSSRIEYAISPFVSWQPRNNDAGPIAVPIPSLIVDPGVPISPQVTIKNYGFNNQPSIPVVMEIYDESKALVYTGTGSRALNSGDTGTVTLSPQWTPGTHGTFYDITVYTTLATDENRANDTGYTFTQAFTITRNMYSYLTSSPPTIDGDIQTTEWSDAERYDVSDVLGQGTGYPYLAGSAYLWVKHDQNFIYFAGAMPYATTANNADQLGLYIDENNDGVWANDSTEGNYWLVNYESPAIDSLIYRALLPVGVWRYGPVPGSEISANLTSGYMQFEGKIPFGTEKYQINADPNGDMMKFWMFAVDRDPPYSDYYGWWPQDVPGDSWRYPHLYGNLILVGSSADVGATAILAPTGNIYQGSSVRPKVVVQNYGVATGSFPVVFEIGSAKDGEYVDTAWISLGVGQIDTVEFDLYHATTIGEFTTNAWTALPGDANPNNNSAPAGSFNVIEAPAATWSWIANIIEPAPGKGVKAGGAMTAVETKSAVLYAFPGNKSKKFVKYVEPSWTEVETIGFGLKYPVTDSSKYNKKVPGKGAALCWDGASTIYATKGNGTFELWRYNLNDGHWYFENWLPSLKGAKGGTALTYKDGLLYVLVGGLKPEFDNFFAYNTTNKTWTTLLKAPTAPDGKPYKDGSCIIALGDRVYVLKGGGKHNYFHAFDGTNWFEKETIPLFHPRLTKKAIVKDGGAMATNGSTIYAIKGGGAQDFWKYEPGKGTWIGLETIPKGVLGKKGTPKTGAALAYGNNYVYLLKGNNTLEVMRYGPIYAELATASVATTQTAVMTSDITGALNFKFDATPNPFNKLTTIKYNVPNSSKVSIKLYNASGRLVKTITDEHHKAGSYTTTLNAKNLANGIYFLKYKDATNSCEVKLIVQ